MLVLGLGLMLFSWMPIIAGVLWLLACKQAFDCLSSSANGWLVAPYVSPGIDNSVVWKYLLLQAIFIGLPILAAVLMEPALGLALFIAFAAVLPAAIMSLAVSGSLNRALSPDLWMTLIFRVGWPYLALIGLMLVIQVSATNAGAILETVLPEQASSLIGVVFSLWSMFATFHLMGYLIFQFHRELDFEPTRLAHSLPRDRLPDRDQELLDRAGALVQGGDVNGALRILRTEVRSRAVTLDVHELYRRLLQQACANDELTEHGRQFLHQLMREKQDKRALQLAHECLELDPGFTALELEQNAVLAKRAEFAGQSRLAIALLLSASRHPAHHADKSLWALHAADLLSRLPGRENEARDLLHRARADCNDKSLCSRIDAQLALLP